MKEIPFSRRVKRISIRQAADFAIASGLIERPMFKITKVDRFGADGYLQIERPRVRSPAFRPKRREKEMLKADIKSFFDRNALYRHDALSSVLPKQEV